MLRRKTVMRSLRLKDLGPLRRLAASLMIGRTGGDPVAHPDDRFDHFASHAPTDRQRVAIAVSLAGLALVLGAVASIHMPSEDQVLQDLVFGGVLGAVYAVTVLGSRIFDFRVVAPGFWLLLLVTTTLWFIGLKHQFAFASTTAFVVGQSVSAGCAIMLRQKTQGIGVLLSALGGLAIEWMLFAYADPRIALLTGIHGSGADRLLGSGTTLLAAIVSAAITAWWLPQQDPRPARS